MNKYEENPEAFNTNTIAGVQATSFDTKSQGLAHSSEIKGHKNLTKILNSIFWNAKLLNSEFWRSKIVPSGFFVPKA